MEIGPPYTRNEDSIEHRIFLFDTLSRLQLGFCIYTCHVFMQYFIIFIDSFSYFDETYSRRKQLHVLCLVGFTVL